MTKPKVAFICVHNSCRSQIAEALGKALASDVFESYSAGTETRPQINQDAVRLMKALYGIDMEQTQYSKLISDIPEPDIAISMGCNVSCPFIGRAFDDNWKLEDPTGKTDDDFRVVIKKNYFKTILVGNTMRVMIDSFEEWYANQFKYQKVDGTPPGEELKKTTYSMEELGQRLGLKEATAYELVAKGHFDVVDVLGKRRVTKESFERWYASQTDYRTVEDQELDANIMASTYGLPEMARMLGVHRQTIYYIVANEDFELIKVGRYKRATKESFEKWYHNQTRYQLAEDRQERS